jgi:nucleoid DNA-binding protein
VLASGERFTSEEDEVTKSELVDQVADRADLTKQIAASRVPRFTAGSSLKSAVKGR